eukprot:1864139-Alexandrium_andersonii.AAC.1
MMSALPHPRGRARPPSVRRTASSRSSKPGKGSPSLPSCAVAQAARGAPIVSATSERLLQQAT